MKEYIMLCLVTLLMLGACELQQTTPEKSSSEYITIQTGILNYADHKIRVVYYYYDVPIIKTKHIDITEGVDPDEHFSLYVPTDAMSLIVEVTGLRPTGVKDWDFPILTESFDLVTRQNKNPIIYIDYDGSSIEFREIIEIVEEPQVIE